MKKIKLPLEPEDIKDLRVGEIIELSGIMYTARDAAHKLICEALEAGEDLPFELENQIIYYVGPSPKRPGEVIGSAGPTTSYRMDSFAPKLMENGLKGMLGKGPRNPEVIKSIKKNKAVYFVTIGGAAAYLSQCVKKAKVIAYEFLGTEAVRKLVVEKLPCIVAIDSNGENIFK